METYSLKNSVGKNLVVFKFQSPNFIDTDYKNC